MKHSIVEIAASRLRNVVGFHSYCSESHLFFSNTSKSFLCLTHQTLEFFYNQHCMVCIFCHLLSVTYSDRCHILNHSKRIYTILQVLIFGVRPPPPPPPLLPILFIQFIKPKVVIVSSQYFLYNLSSQKLLLCPTLGIMRARDNKDF